MNAQRAMGGESGGDSGEAAALRKLRRSGRRLVETPKGWVVLSRSGRRRRFEAMLDAAAARRLVALGRVLAAEGGGYVLPPDERAEMSAEPLPCAKQVLALAGQGGRRGGAGFAQLAAMARAGGGPLSMRQAQAGLKLAADAETAARRAGLTMDWDGAPADNAPRGPAGGGMTLAAMDAQRRLSRVKAAMGAKAFGLCWGACVDGRSLGALAQRAGMGVRRMERRLAAALETVAAAYER